MTASRDPAVPWSGMFECHYGVELHRIVVTGGPWLCHVERYVDGEWRHDVVSSATEARVIKHAYLELLSAGAR